MSTGRNTAKAMTRSMVFLNSASLAPVNYSPDACAVVVGYFQETIDRVIALAVFLPVLIGQAANTGVQALAVSLRG